MSFLFEPVSAAIQTLKHIKSASDKGPDPERFIVRLPANPGKWAMNMAFKRQHNLWKWTKYRQAKLPRKLKLKTLKIVKHGEKSDFPEQITSEFDEASSYMRVTAPADSSGLALPSGQSRPSQDSLAKDATTAQLTATVSPSSTSAGAVDADKDGMPYFHMPDDDEAENEMKRLAMMSPEQKVYMRSCDHYKVRPLRQILKQIDSKEIVLAHTKMRDMEFKAFTTSLIMNFTVKRLDLSDTLPTERQTTYLNDFLEDDNGITDLILKDNKLEGRMVARMFDSMRRRDVMIYLDISGNNLRDKDLPVLAAYIETSSQLSFLHMANNKFTSKAGEPLGKMMAQAALVELNISCNRLRGDGMAAFLTAIAKSNSLERLDVSWNGIGPEAVRGLCTLLRQSTSIVSLDLTATSINGECLELICTQGLSKNGVLQRLELKNNPLLTQDLTTFLTRLYSYQTIAIRRVDLGDYQMLDSSVEHLLEALFWERQIYIRSAGTFAYSGRSDTLENIVQRFKKDSLSLVTRLDHGQRTALVKHFAQVDMQEAVEMGSDIISNSFLGRANDNKVTYKDLALRINMERKNPRDVINSILEKQEVPEHTKKWVSRFSSTPEEIRKTQLLTRDS